MTHTSHDDGDQSTGPRKSSQRFPSPDAQAVRVAHALIERCPDEIRASIAGAQIGDSSTGGRAEPTAHARTRDDLPGALRSVATWYRDTLGIASKSDVDDAAERSVVDLLRTYLSLRSQWEDREARAIARQMTDGLQRLRPQQLQPAASDEALDVVSDAGPSGCKHEAPVADSLSQQLTGELGAGRRRRRALLVDDASDVVVTVGAFLEAFGFDVLSASSGDMALRILADGGAVDLLVTDHAMPGMVGKDLAGQACQQWPNLRALIITGYPDAEELAELSPGVSILAKPFRRAELLERIQRLLDDRTEATARETSSSAG